MYNPEYSVEFVFDYMVILTDVNPIWTEDLTDEAIENMARDNLISEYGFNPFDHHLQDIVVHCKDDGHLPPSHPALTLLK
jgi:hypothetical protein